MGGIMLMKFIEKALAIGGDSIQIEYKDRKEWITAFRGCVGFGIRESEPRQGQNHIQRNGRSEKEERSDHWEIEIPIGIFPTGELWRTGVLDSDESKHRIRAAGGAAPRVTRKIDPEKCLPNPDGG